MSNEALQMRGPVGGTTDAGEVCLVRLGDERLVLDDEDPDHEGGLAAATPLSIVTATTEP